CNPFTWTKGPQHLQRIIETTKDYQALHPKKPRRRRAKRKKVDSIRNSWDDALVLVYFPVQNGVFCRRDSLISDFRLVWDGPDSASPPPPAGGEVGLTSTRGPSVCR